MPGLVYPAFAMVTPVKRPWPGRRDLLRLALLLTPVLAAFAALALAILTGTIGQPEEAMRVDLKKRVDVTLSEPVGGLTYAYLPQYSHAVSYERHHRIVEYLRQATGLPIRQVYPDTFEDHIKMVGDGAIDISFVNPFVFAKLNERYGAQAIARIVGIEDEGEYFYGEIIARADNKAVQRLEDCRGKRWIAVDPSSAGGYLFPLGHFVANGIRKQDFAEIAFAPGPGGKQEKVILSVYSGKYDIGTVRNGSRALLEDRIDLAQIRVLAQSRKYPNWVFAARKGLSQDVQRKIKEALVSLSPNIGGQAAILEAARIRSIVPASNADFAPVRELMTLLEKEGELAP